MIFDPRAPDNVLLASAMNTDHVIWDNAVGIAGCGATAIGLGWWLVGRKRRQRTAMAADL